MTDLQKIINERLTEKNKKQESTQIGAYQPLGEQLQSQCVYDYTCIYCLCKDVNR